MSLQLPVVESFHSLQGEGAHAGKSAYFIRLASCKVGCAWCDTKNSWSIEDHPLETIEDLSTNVVKARRDGAGFVVLTGGEPLHHDLNALCSEIRRKTEDLNLSQMKIHIETSGVDILSGKPDWITLSPKPHYPPRLELLNLCDEMKIIIHRREDINFAETMLSKINKEKNPKLFLQGGWNNKVGQNLAFEYVKHNPRWRLSMQTHKWLGIM
tara:strand:+ start:1158 stop:1793 length:636 start_codon:yes stop_codon:yes gene_type:complete